MSPGRGDITALGSVVVLLSPLPRLEAFHGVRSHGFAVGHTLLPLPGLRLRSWLLSLTPMGLKGRTPGVQPKIWVMTTPLGEG